VARPIPGLPDLETFSQNVSGALADPGARFAQVGGQLKSGFSGQGFNLGQQFTPPLAPSGQAPADFRGADYQGAPDSAYGQVNNAGVTPEQIQARDLIRFLTTRYQCNIPAAIVIAGLLSTQWRGKLI
jgi:hypothetical protein